MRLTEATPEEPHETARHVHCRAIPLLQQPAGWLCHLVLLSRQALRYRQSRWANRPCYHRCLRRQHGQRCAMLPRHANAIPMHAMPRNAGRTLCWLCIHMEAIVRAAGGAGSCCTACSYCMAGVSSQRLAAGRPRPAPIIMPAAWLAVLFCAASISIYCWMAVQRVGVRRASAALQALPAPPAWPAMRHAAPQRQRHSYACDASECWPDALLALHTHRGYSWSCWRCWQLLHGLLILHGGRELPTPGCQAGRGLPP